MHVVMKSADVIITSLRVPFWCILFHLQASKV